jgi:hypothetical protein
MKKLILFLAVTLSLVEGSFAQQQKYSRVKIYADMKGLAQLAQAGVCIDEGDMKRNVSFTSDFSASEINVIKQKGFKYDILIDDVKQFYKDQNDPKSSKYVPPVTPQNYGCGPLINFPTPSHFNLGSMGGFFTYSEIMNKLDSMPILFPNLVKAKVPISGTNSIEGRPIYWMKISDNPNVDESEPEMLYTANHHAREPAAVAQLIMYMYYLLENYNTNAEVKYLVDNLEMYFVPMVNPDGYIYNETTDPGGGGMWRKNRRDNGGGKFGVDLNRNYDFKWGFDNVGSSQNSGSDTYRGTAGFSEPETQNLRDFCNAHQFKLTLNYHTFGNLLIYGWGYQPSIYTPDSATFVEYAKYLTVQNHYNYGTPDQTVGYITNGSSDDWMYGEQTTKPMTYAMTPEAGVIHEGFWPPANRIVTVCKENILQNLHAAELLLKTAVATDDEPRYISTTNGYFNYKIKRLGLAAPASFTVSITPITSNITSTGLPKVYSSLSLLQQTSDSISFTLNSFVSGQTVQYLLSVDNGAYVQNDTVTKMYGTPVIPFSSDGNSMTGWTSATWGTDSQYFHSSTSSISDSPGGNYNSDDSTFITTAANVDLTACISATLTFWTRWETEPRVDYVEVQASTDNGANWDKLCGKYSKAGTAYEDQDEPVYDGYQFEWFREEINMDNYINQNVLLRFFLKADNGGEANGFFFDDLKVEKIASNTAVHELDNTLQFSVSPNPTTGEFKVQGLGFKIQSIVITDVLGNIVKPSATGHQPSVIDLSGNPRGIYFVRVIDEKGNFGARKIILQ